MRETGNVYNPFAVSMPKDEDIVALKRILKGLG